MIDEACMAKSDSPGDTREQIERTATALEAIDECVSGLERKLAPVLRDDASPSPDCRPQKQPGTELGRQVDILAVTAERINDTIRSISQRADI